MGDKVFVNGRAAVHKGSQGKSVAFPDICLCPPSPPSGPIPTPLPNNVAAKDLAGGASSVLIESHPAGKKSSYFKLSTGNEVSRPTGGGVVTHGVQGKAHFQTYAVNVFFEGEPAVRHLDMLTHNHTAPNPGNTPPFPWLSVMDAPPVLGPKTGKKARDRKDEKKEPPVADWKIWLGVHPDDQTVNKDELVLLDPALKEVQRVKLSSMPKQGDGILVTFKKIDRRARYTLVVERGEDNERDALFVDFSPEEMDDLSKDLP